MLFKNRSKTYGLLGGVFSANISTNQLELNLANWAANNGWDGLSNAAITIDTGIYVYSNNINTPALTTGVFPKGLKIIVNGFIMGKGGRGGGFGGNDTATAYVGQNGGTAIKLECNTTISGSAGAYIGGGGGGGSYAFYDFDYKASGGGGAGGGQGGGMHSTTNGGAGGAPGASGGNGVVQNTENNGPSAALGIGGTAGGTASSSAR